MITLSVIYFVITPRRQYVAVNCPGNIKHHLITLLVLTLKYIYSLITQRICDRHRDVVAGYISESIRNNSGNRRGDDHIEQSCLCICNVQMENKTCVVGLFLDHLCQRYS